MGLFDWLRRDNKTVDEDRSQAPQSNNSQSLTALPKKLDGSFRFVALDVETASSDHASICQIGLACVRPDNSITTHAYFVNPDAEFDPFNIKIHGIRPTDVVSAPLFPDVLNAILPLLTRHHIIQHSNFDKQAIQAECNRYRVSHPELMWSDSVRIARRAWPELKGNGGHGLANLKTFLGLEFNHHNAEEDARAAAQVVQLAEKALNLDLEILIQEMRRPKRKKYPNKITREGNPNGAFNGETVVFTGAIGMTRQEAANLAASVGMSVRDSVTKKTNYLVSGDQDVTMLAGHEKSGKLRKAEEMQKNGHQIRILTGKNFAELVLGAKKRT